MLRVLVVATSKYTHGGITAVLKQYENSSMWQRYHCVWIGTHRDGYLLRKVWYFIWAMIRYICLLPFYDIVHIHFSLAISAKRKYPFFRLAKLLGKGTIIHLHCGSQIDENWSPVYQKMFERCDFGIVLSEGLKATVEKFIGKNDKIRVVYNPCPSIYSRVSFEKKNYILFSGTLSKGKGYQDLIYAFAKVYDKHKGWKVVLAGNGEVEHARALSSSLGISECVMLLGWVDGNMKHKVFSESQALCLPSYAEGFPMAVLDAWAYGLPVLATPVGGLIDVAKDFENMLVFEPGDVDTLSKKLDLLMSNTSLRQQLAEESLRLSAGQFNLGTITEQIGEIYCQV